MNTGAAALRSPVSWALLGLVIERPGNGNEFLERFERAYGDALPLNSTSQIYVALSSLAEKELIKEIPADPVDSTVPSSNGRPKPSYHSTPKGVRAYQEWLIAQAGTERRRSRLFALQVATLTPEAALHVIDSYELACLAKLNDSSAAAKDSRDELAARLASEEDRLAIGARLTWIEYARRELKALIKERPKDRPTDR